MTGFIGMDIQAVRALANQLHTDADEIDRIANTLTTQLGNAHWVGSDANNFRDNWNSSYRAQLNTVSTALRDAATCANNNATQQEQASS
jgi:uncharacterized protein YukE